VDIIQNLVIYGGIALVAALAIRGIYARSGARLAAYFFGSAAVVIVTSRQLSWHTGGTVTV